MKWYNLIQKLPPSQTDEIHNALLIIQNFIYKFDGIGIHDEPLDLSLKEKIRSLKIEIDAVKKGDPPKIFELEGTTDMKLG